jgi:hypothetical protein
VKTISSQLIQQTAAFWDEYAEIKLSDEEARQAVENINGFFNVLNTWDQADRVQEGMGCNEKLSIKGENNGYLHDQ